MFNLRAIFIFNFFTLNVTFSFFKTNHLTVLLYFFIALVLSIVILIFSYYFALQKPSLEKFSNYECGFEPYGDSRSQFELRFYIVAILFLVFDLETIFLLPACLNLSKLDLLSFWSILDFIVELLVSFFYVWYIGALNWD